MPITKGNITVVDMGIPVGTTRTVSTHDHDGDFLTLGLCGGFGFDSQNPQVVTAQWDFAGTPVALNLLHRFPYAGGSTALSMSLWYLAGAAQGAKQLRLASVESERRGIAVMRSFSGVNLISPFRTVATDTHDQNVDNTGNVSPVSEVGDLILDMMAYRQVLAGTRTLGGGQTSDVDLKSGTEIWAIGSTKDGAAGSTAMSIALTPTVQGGTYRYLGVALKPAPKSQLWRSAGIRPLKLR